jgi:hypothetical protein
VVFDRAAQLIEAHRHETEVMTLDALSGEFDIRPRTLRAFNAIAFGVSR